MLKWKFPAAVFFLLVILPYFSACGKEEILTIEIPEEQEAYQTREVLLDGIQKAWSVQASEGFYYVMAKKQGNKIVMLKLNKNGEILEETPLDIKGETIISIEDFRIEEDGGISCLAVMMKQDAVSASSWNVRYLCFDKNGRKASGTLLRFPEEETGNVSDGMFTEDGMLFLASNGLYLFREDGTFSQKYEVNGSSFCLLEKDACVSSALSKTAFIKRIGLEKGELVHESRIGLSAIRYQSLLCAAGEKSGYDLIIADNEGIYGYCFQPEKITELLSWQEKDIVIGNMAMYDFLVTGEEYVVLLDANPGCSLLFVSRDMGQKKKEKAALTLCGIGLLSDNMKIAVAAWNKEHGDQRIVMETRDSDQLALDIVSGDGPDIIVADASVEAGISVLKNLSEKGYFADWYRLMEQDASGLQKKDLLHNIREIYETEQGELFYLPVSYLVGFSAASAEDVKNRKRWSFDDMDALLSEKREKEDSVGIFAENKLDLVKTLLRYGFDDYYSPEEGLKTENLKSY